MNKQITHHNHSNAQQEPVATVSSVAAVEILLAFSGQMPTAHEVQVYSGDLSTNIGYEGMLCAMGVITPAQMLAENEQLSIYDTSPFLPECSFLQATTTIELIAQGHALQSIFGF